MRALRCQRTAASLDPLFLQRGTRTGASPVLAGSGRRAVPQPRAVQPGTKPAARWGLSAQLLPRPDQPSGSHTQLRPQDTLLRPCYMPRPGGQCCPQTSTPPCTVPTCSHFSCFCPSSAGRGQGWDSSLCTSLLSLLGTPQPSHCRVIGVHILRFTTLPLMAIHQTLGNLHA